MGGNCFSLAKKVTGVFPEGFTFPNSMSLMACASPCPLIHIFNNAFGFCTIFLSDMAVPLLINNIVLGLALVTLLISSSWELCRWRFFRSLPSDELSSLKNKITRSEFSAIVSGVSFWVLKGGLHDNSTGDWTFIALHSILMLYFLSLFNGKLKDSLILLLVLLITIESLINNLILPEPLKVNV